MSDVIVLGNGPSLSKFDNSLQDKYMIFGSNRVYLKLVPGVYACVNPLIAEQSKNEITQLKCKRYVTDLVSIPGCHPLHSTTTIPFSFAPQFYINEGFTVTYVLLQLAFFYGAKNVYLFGVDHKFNYSGDPNAEVTWQGKDTNHFSDDYMKPGEKWNNPDLKNSELSYKVAKRVFENDGRRIINCTPDSALDVFEKGTL